MACAVQCSARNFCHNDENGMNERVLVFSPAKRFPLNIEVFYFWQFHLLKESEYGVRESGLRRCFCAICGAKRMFMTRENVGRSFVVFCAKKSTDRAQARSRDLEGARP